MFDVTNPTIAPAYQNFSEADLWKVTNEVITRASEPNSLYSQSPINPVNPYAPNTQIPGTNPWGNEKMSEVYKNQMQVMALLNNPQERMRINNLAQSLKSSFHTLLPDDTKQINNILTQLTPHELAALEIAYGQMSGKPGQLRNDIRMNLTINMPGSEINARKAFDLLNQGAKVSIDTASIALRDAMEGWGTNEETVKDIVNNSSNEFLTMVMPHYQNMFGTSLTDDIKGDFSWMSGESDLMNRINNALIQSRSSYQTQNSYGIQFQG